MREFFQWNPGTPSGVSFPAQAAVRAEVTVFSARCGRRAEAADEERAGPLPLEWSKTQLHTTAGRGVAKQI